MAIGNIWTVTCSSLFIRSGAGTKYGTIGVLHEGDKVVEISTTVINGTTWLQHDAGWTCASYMKKVSNGASTVTTIEGNSSPPTQYELKEQEAAGYQPDVTDILSYQNTTVADSEFVKIKNVAGVFGLPYQFLPNTDIRLTSDQKTENIGYEYADKIIEHIPLLFIAPGKANFMTKYSKKAKQDIIDLIIKENAGVDSASIDDLLSTDGRYYTFEYDKKRYYQFVNPMCRIAARYLEIHDYEINGSKLDTINWETFTNSGINSLGNLGSIEYSAIPFYLDSETSVHESFSNSTTQSTIATSVNSISDMGRELQFLLGANNNINSIEALEDADVQSSLENVKDIISRLMGSGNFLTNLANNLTTVASGGKLVFPEIWSDSSFSRSYNCELKFISPDPSKLSIYLNVLVPLFHLLGLVAPHSIVDNPNGYINPFIIRAVYKGFFNVDMGIITDMSVTKGAECQWTPEGVPTSINVSITIKDLYSAMSITSTTQSNWKYDTLNNTALMDYIANLCGINIFKPEIGRIIDMWLVNNFENRVQDRFQVDIWAGIQDKVQNLITSIYR